MNTMNLLSATLLAVSAATAAEWTYYPEGHANNPHPAGNAYPVISNGTWVLNVEPLPHISASALNLGCSDATKVSLYGGIDRGSAFTGIGSGALDLRGTICHVDSPSTTYYLHSCGTMSLGVSSDASHKARTSAMTSCHTPGTLRSIGKQLFNSEYKVIKSICLDEPFVTGKFDGTWNFPDNLKHLELNLPGVTEISKANVVNNLFQDAPYTNSFAMWTLTGVTNVAAKALCQIGKMTGRLSLPSLVVAGDYAFTNSAFTSIVLGRPGVVTTFGTAAFDGCVALKEMVIRGDPPATLANAWGTENHAARTMVFSVPFEEDVWQTFLDGKIVRKVDSEEAAAFITQNPGISAMPSYVVDASAFGTANEQYLAGIARYVCDFDEFFGDAVTLESATGEKISDGEYPVGTTITLRAETGSAAGAQFAGWYGDTDGAEIVTDTNGTWSRITFTLAKNTWLFARFTHPWTYDSEARVVCNGKWVLNVTPDSVPNRLLKLGNSNATGLFAVGRNSNTMGVLDMGGRVSDGTDEWVFSQFSAIKGLCCPSNNVFATGNPTVFISPSTCRQFCGGQLFNPDRGCLWTYTTIILDEPFATGSIPNWYMSKQLYCRRLILLAPKLGAIGSMGVFGTDSDSTPLDLTDFSWWRLDSLTTVQSGTFLQNYSRTTSDTFFGINARGTLSLPACTFVGANAFRGMPRLSGIVLGGATKQTMVTSICETAVAECPSLKVLTLHSGNSLTVAADAFSNTVLSRVRFLGDAPTSTTLSAMLNAVDATAPANRDCTIYASTRFNRWLSSLASDMESHESAIAPNGTFGVWRDGESAPNGKAWLVDSKSPYDPVGLRIFLR